MSLEEATPSTCSPSETRRILRSLRDLNLSGARLEVRPGDTIAIRGCISLDAPAEQGVRYRLRLAGGQDAVLAIRAEASELHLSLDGDEIEPLELATRLECRAGSTAECPDLSARLDFESLGPRELEHFLRRIVRGLMKVA